MLEQKCNLRISQVAERGELFPECPWINIHWGNILLLDFFGFSRSKASDANITIIVCVCKKRNWGNGEAIKQLQQGVCRLTS